MTTRVSPIENFNFRHDVVVCGLCSEIDARARSSFADFYNNIMRRVTRE